MRIRQGLSGQLILRRANYCCPGDRSCTDRGAGIDQAPYHRMRYRRGRNPGPLPPSNPQKESLESKLWNPLGKTSLILHFIFAFFCYYQGKGAIISDFCLS